jgi:hypothetical protein
VGPAGYTNSFDLQPPAEDWATANRAGNSNDAYDMDSEANTNITAGAVTNQTTVNANNPASVLANATWSSSGLYLQTRSTAARYTTLMGKFVNNTGSNATEIAISYALTIAGNVAAEEPDKGTRVYYSLSGLTNSWVNLTTFNTLASNAMTVNLSTNLAINWPLGSNLFLLWLDDNAIPADVANEIDNFSIRLTAGAAPTVLGIINTPTNNSVAFSDTSVLSSVSVFNGTPPYVLKFWTNVGVVNTNFQLAGTISSPLYNFDLGTFAQGTYRVYASVTDENGSGKTSNTATNNFSSVNALITLTSPTNNQSSPPGQPFLLGATVSVGAFTTVTNVEFFYNGVSAAVDITAPYSGSIPSPLLGTQTVYAVATDNLGRQTYSRTNQLIIQVDPLGNNFFANRYTLGTPTTVTGANAGAGTEQFEPTGTGGFGGVNWGATLWWSWTAPLSGTVTIDTIGSSFNTYLAVYTGTVVSALTLVQRNDNAPGLANVSLVSFTAQQGTEYLVQVGGVRTGGGPGGGQIATGNIQLNVAMPPSVVITTPTNGSTYFVGSNIAVEVTAGSGAGAVTNVSLYRGTTLLGTLTNAPYSFVISNAPAGTNALYATATDTIGQVGTSAVVPVLVASVGVTIVSPLDGAVFGNTNPITVSAFTILPSGSIANVTFFVDGQPIGLDNTVPFSAVWTNVTGGSHRLTATGVDGVGTPYEAAPVYIGVGQLLVHSNAVWKYLDDGTDQSNAWYAVSYNDLTWLSGPAELGYGDGDEATVVNSGPTNSFFITTYFRRSFVASNVAGISNMILALAYDDAGAVYLNGKELYRTSFLPTNAAYNTPANIAIGIEETVDTVTVASTNLVEGTNVLAVEIHQQAPNSSDISFFLQLVGLPRINRNQFPVVALTNLVNGTSFVAPASITLAAAASDPDGSVTNVEFYADGLKLGEDATSPYSFSWPNPPAGFHTVYAVATDDHADRQASAAVNIQVYGAAGLPLVSITSPANGSVVEGPTNMLVTANATALDGVTNVEFFVNGLSISNDAAGPYSALWNAPFGTNQLWAIASGANGKRGTSAVVTAVITIPPTNTVPPFIVSQIPAAYAMITNLTNITIVFSERVHGVDASDLLINGVPATSLTGSGSIYTFFFPQPPYGDVSISFASDHNIFDFGYPMDLMFNDFSTNSAWVYDLFDRTPPRVAIHVPATGTTVTNLTTISVSFSENVTGVDAGDLLVNGVPAYNITGSGSNYTFNVFQPASGTINITWATNHGIADMAVAPNDFVRTATGNTWSFTLDSRTVLIQTNSVWKFVKGTNEASNPTNAWRQQAFDDSSWSNASAPFVFGEPTFTNALTPGTILNDMTNNVTNNVYSSIYLRKQFVLTNFNGVTNLFLSHASDDGFIAWLNGTEVFRFNMPTGQVGFDGSARGNATESGNNAGVPFIAAQLTNALPALIKGTNIFAVHAFNFVTNPASSDFVFNAQLYTFVTDFTVVPPRITQTDPVPGDIFSLSNVTITFSEGVTNVNASDVLVNGTPATSLTSSTNTTYTFGFLQPPYGPVVVKFATNHGIVDFDTPPKPFDSTVANATLTYALVNPNAPTIFAQTPESVSTVTGLTSVNIVFSKPVAGVDASDLLINGSPTASVSGSGSNYTFNFLQPPFGVVTVRWATNHGIKDLDVPANDFDITRPLHIWSYALINPVPTVTMTSPTNNAYMLSPVNVPLRATATDNDGVIAKVEYYEYFEDFKIGEATASPYLLTWSNRTEGVFGIFAVATDDSGLKATSAPVVINVVTSLPVLLVRGPYLQSGSTTGAVVRWRTDQISDAIVRWGPSPTSLPNFAVQTNVRNDHIVQLTGLQPNTKYFYSIGSSSRQLAGGTNLAGSNFWFYTHPPVGTQGPTRFWVLGDPGTANANQMAVRDAYLNMVAAGGKRADLWLMLGDNAYQTGTDTEYQNAVFDMYPTVLRNQFLWPVIGNHDAQQPGTGGGSPQNVSLLGFPYLDIFTLPQNGEAGGLPTGNPKYYSFDYANVHFVGLDSMTSGRETNSPMVLWLQNDLDSHTQAWTIVYFHHSLYTHGTHNSDTEADLVGMRQVFNPILDSHGVDLVLMGHSHVYERSYLIDGHYGIASTFTPSMKIDPGLGREDGSGAYRKDSDERGVVYSIVGSSGQALGGTLDHPAHAVSLNLLGSLLVDVNSNRLDAMFLTSAGTTNDHYTLIKRGPAPSVPLNVAAQFVTTNQIRLTWIDQANNELGYIIERSFDCVNYTRIATNGPNTTQFLDSGLLPGTTYCYRVRSYNGQNESVASNIASGSTSVPRAVLGAGRNLLTGTRALSISGVTGTVYSIERTTNVADVTSWQNWQSVTLSNFSQIIDASSGTNTPSIFYRAKQ